MMWLVKRSYLGLVAVVAGYYLISRYLFEKRPRNLALRSEIESAVSVSEEWPTSALSETTPNTSESVVSEEWPTAFSSALSETTPTPKTFEPMALSLNYWEQTANAIMNLFDLQCWASTVSLSGVVEPSILRDWGSGVFHTLSEHSSRFTFRNFFDLDHWNSMSLKYSVSPLVSLQDFLENAARDIVYVQVIYHRFDREYCRPLSSVAKSKWALFLRSKGFHLAKTVCINFSMNASMNEEEFREKIFEGIDHPVTVLFNRFRGISPLGKGARLVMTGPLSGACARRLKNFDTSIHPTTVRYTPINSSSQIVPSKRIVEYVKRFISEKLSGERYIAVMLRTERLKNLLPKKTESDTCASNVISDWEEMVAKNNIHKTLYFSDTENHGSLGWTDNRIATKFSRYIQNAMNLDLSVDQVNSIIEDMTGSKDSVQIAALHQQLVAHATCVVVVGGGRFQSQTLNMYFYNHRGQECYSYRDGFCNSSYVDQIYGL